MKEKRWGLTSPKHLDASGDDFEAQFPLGLPFGVARFVAGPLTGHFEAGEAHNLGEVGRFGEGGAAPRADAGAS